MGVGVEDVSVAGDVAAAVGNVDVVEDVDVRSVAAAAAEEQQGVCFAARAVGAAGDAHARAAGVAAGELPCVCGWVAGETSAASGRGGRRAAEEERSLKWTATAAGGVWRSRPVTACGQGWRERRMGGGRIWPW